MDSSGKKITSEVLIGTVKFSEQGSAGAVSRISGDRLSATWAPGSVMAGRKYSAEPARTPLLSVHRVKPLKLRTSLKMRICVFNQRRQTMNVGTFLVKHIQSAY